MAATKEISVEPAIGSVLSELDGHFTRRTKNSTEGNMISLFHFLGRLKLA